MTTGVFTGKGGIKIMSVFYRYTSVLRYHRALRRELGEGWIQSLKTENFSPENFPAETHFYLICDMAMMKHLMNISNL